MKRIRSKENDTLSSDVKLMMTKKPKLNTPPPPPRETRHLIIEFNEEASEPSTYLVTIKEDDDSCAAIILSTLDDLVKDVTDWEKMEKHEILFNAVRRIVYYDDDNDDDDNEKLKETFEYLNKNLTWKRKLTSKKDIGNWWLLSGVSSKFVANFSAFNTLGPVITHIYYS
jgi:hypothetical protein